MQARSTVSKAIGDGAGYQNFLAEDPAQREEQALFITREFSTQTQDVLPVGHLLRRVDVVL